MTRGYSTSLTNYIPGRIWLYSYPVRYFGSRFDSRTTLIRLANGDVVAHSPGPLSEGLHSAVAEIGPLRVILAPSTFHHLHVEAWQRAFCGARTLVCPGLPGKRPRLRFDGVLGHDADRELAGEFDQVVQGGNEVMREVALLHRPSRTLLLVDLVERFTSQTRNTNLLLRLWMRLFGMWGKPRPAPEIRFLTRDKAALGRSLERILAWDFERVILAHGDLIETEPHLVLADAWSRYL